MLILPSVLKDLEKASCGEIERLKKKMQKAFILLLKIPQICMAYAGIGVLL